MGWLYTRDASKADVRDEILRGLNYQNDHSKMGVLAHRTVGNHLWVAVEREPAGEQAHRFIFLALLQRSDGDWGYKDMAEMDGPYHHDCPLSLLKLMDEPPNEWAAEWRERVRGYHAEQKRRKALQKSVKVGSVVTLTERYGRQIFRVRSLAPFTGTGADGRTYKLPKNAIAEVAEGE